jgi:hypothetical protein
MTYTKPEVAVLGEAGYVIQQLVKAGSNTDPSGGQKITPAYDLDE